LGLRGKGKGGEKGKKGSEATTVGEKRKVADGEISKYFAPKSGESAAELKQDAFLSSRKRIKSEQSGKVEEEEEAKEKPRTPASPENDDDSDADPNPTTTTTSAISQSDDSIMAAQIARIASSTTLTPFRKQTLTLLCRIPRGRWSTYQAMSDHITATSHKTCARAVGNAMRNNPYAPDVPCHRILSSDGSIGGFGGHWGAEGKFAGEKRELLGEEGVVFDSKGKVRGRPFRDFGG
jgi:methylated-DNA-[protein]-cysteine S-methyltransferase